MTTSYDVIVLGLGGMGSAAAAHLARRGARVLGLEQFSLGHDRGASQGESRLIRKAYFESPRYVPLLERAYALWDELNDEVAERGEPGAEAKRGARAPGRGGPLLWRCGLALCAAAQGERDAGSILARASATARQLGIAVEHLAAAEVRARWPVLQPPDGFTCLYEPGAGLLDVERCVAAHLERAARAGAELRGGQAVHEWMADADGVTVTTAEQRYRAGALVVTAGPWSANVLRELALPLQVHRVMQLWFGADEAMALERGTPCYAFDVAGHFVYGFPTRGPRGAKICEHAAGRALTVSQLEDVDPALHEADTAAVMRTIRAYLPRVEPRPLHSKACFYTMTPDQDFIVDTHPAHPRVHFAAGFSGHGFKFASVIGEILADLALRGGTELPIEFLRQRWR